MLLRVLVLALTLLSASAQAETDAVQRWQELNQDTISAFNKGDMGAAETAARVALEFAIRHLQNSPEELAQSYSNHGVLLENAGRLAKGRAAHDRALEIRQSMQPEDPGAVANSLLSLADVDFQLQDNAGAATGYRKAIEAYDAAGFDAFFPNRGLALSIDRLAAPSVEELNEGLEAALRAVYLYNADRRAQYPDLFVHDVRLAMHFASATGRMAELRPLAEAYVALLNREALGDVLTLGVAQRDLARVYEAEQEFAAAERSYNEAMDTVADVANGVTPEMAGINLHLGDMLNALGRYGDAKRAYFRVLEIERQLHGDAHHITIASYERLGNLLIRDGRPVAAEGVLRRGLDLSEQVHGPGHSQTARLADNLGVALSSQWRHDEAIVLLQRALSIQQQGLGRENVNTATTMNNLAMVYNQAGRMEEALDLYRQTLRIRRKELPAGNIGIKVSLENLAVALANTGTDAAMAEALGHLKEALHIGRRVYPKTHEQLSNTLDELGLLSQKMQLHDVAAEYLREAAAIRSAAPNRPTLPRKTATFDAAVSAVLALSGNHAGEAFELAQWPIQSTAGAAFEAAARRVATGDPALGSMLRHKQDLQARHAGLNAQMLEALGTEDEAEKARLRGALAETTAQLAKAEVAMATQFPDFAQFQAGLPASVTEVSDLLAADEALVLLRPGSVRFTGQALPGAVFVVRPGGRVTAALLEAGHGLHLDARALLCSVHAGVSNCPAAAAPSGFTRGVFSFSDGVGEQTGPLGYNLDLAHDLFLRLFGPIEEELRQAKRLIIVPGDETLATLPVQMLLSAPMPDGVKGEADAYARAHWMIRDWAVTVLPNVSALTHARRDRLADVPGGAPRFLGVGDPVIGTATPFDCGNDSIPLQVAALDRAVQSVQTATLWQGAGPDGAIADVDAVRRLTRLPDTRCELQRIAAALGGGRLLMDEKASEATLKTMSETGALAGFDVISFATHGLIAGEIDNAEPALVLTPPPEGSARDDGLLTAGEIAQLQLDAEWVLLSACNTAAGQVTGRDGITRAESFSGLARSFFYAGARNLLVSHWPVQSPAAVRLTTATFDAMTLDPTLDRARAFQMSMLAILDDPDATVTTLHPQYWAPFTLLGGRG